MSGTPYKFYKVADITNVADSEKVAGAIFFDDATETLHIYGANDVPKIYGSRKWIWADIIKDTALLTEFVNDVGIADCVQLGTSELKVVANKRVLSSTSVEVTLVAPKGFDTLTFVTSDSGATWAMSSSINEDFGDFVPTTEVSEANTPNTIVKRDSDKFINVSGFYDGDLMYAFPGTATGIEDDILVSDSVLINTLTNYQPKGSYLTQPNTIPVQNRVLKWDGSGVADSGIDADHIITKDSNDEVDLAGLTVTGATLGGAVCTDPIDDYNVAHKYYVDSKVATIATHNKGYFADMAALAAAYPTAAIGDIAFVGYSYPYAIYAWDGNSQWYDTGETGGDPTIDTTKFLTAAIYLDEELEDVESTYLPTAGGTVTGNIEVLGAIITPIINTETVRVSSSINNIGTLRTVGAVTFASTLSVGGDTTLVGNATIGGTTTVASLVVQDKTNDDILLGDGSTMKVSDIAVPIPITLIGVSNTTEYEDIDV